MHEANMAILKGLVPVVWADGTYDKQEREVIDALLEAFGATEEEAKQFRSYAEVPRTVEDIPITDLSYADRRVLFQHAVFLSFAGGKQTEHEVKVLEQMSHMLRLEPGEAKGLMEAAMLRAKRYIGML